MKYIDIVFQPVQESRDHKPELEFVEVENAQGKSVGVGRWIDRSDGFTVLRLFEDVVKSMTEADKPARKLYPVPFLCGDGSGDIMIDVLYVCDFPRGYDSTCAFCHGDPCNEFPKEGSHIAEYFKRNEQAETCPCCSGKPT